MTKSIRETGTKQRMLHEAARLFAERGYDAVSVREIVEASDVKKPTLYYHFDSKEGLATELFKSFFDAQLRMRITALELDLEVGPTLVAHGKLMTEWARGNTDIMLFAFSVWLGQSSLISQQKYTQDFESNSHKEWVKFLVSKGLEPSKAVAVRKLYWAQLMLAMLQISRNGLFPEDTEAFAKEIADNSLYGALGKKRE